MRCVNKADADAAARMHAAGEQASPCSAAGVSSPAAADKQPATHNGRGARGHSRVDSSSSASDEVGNHMHVDSELEVV